MVKEIEASYAPPDEAFEALLSLLKNQPPQEWRKEKEYSSYHDSKKNYYDKNKILSNQKYSEKEKESLLMAWKEEEKRISETPKNIKSSLDFNRKIGFNTVIKIDGKKFKFVIEKWISQEKIAYIENKKEEIYPPVNTFRICVEDVKSKETVDDMESDYYIEPVFNSIEEKFNTYHNQK